MKRTILIAMLACLPRLYAANTIITGTVTDPSGNRFTGGATLTLSTPCFANGSLIGVSAINVNVVAGSFSPSLSIVANQNQISGDTCGGPTAPPGSLASFYTVQYFVTRPIVAWTEWWYVSQVGGSATLQQVRLTNEPVSGDTIFGGVSSVFSRTGTILAQSGDYTSDQVTEGFTNLYFTNARVLSAMSGLYQTPITNYSFISGLTGYPTSFPPITSGSWTGTWQGNSPSFFQAALTNYSTISVLTGYPTSFPPINSGDWAGTWQSHAPSYFQTAISGAPGTWPTFYYQTVKANGTNQTQRPNLNFSTDFTVSDQSGINSTQIALTFPALCSGGQFSQGFSTGSNNCAAPPGGVASVTGDGALFTNLASTGTVTLALGNAGAHKFWGDNTGTPGTPAYASIGVGDLPGTGGTTVNGQTCTLGAACTIPLSAVNAQTATYQVLAADFSNYKTISVASGTFTVTMVSSGSQPANGQYIHIINYGSGTVTIARSGQNINGGTTSLTLAAGSATAPTSAMVESDGTNYVASVGGGTSGGSSTGTSFQAGNGSGGFAGTNLNQNADGTDTAAKSLTWASAYKPTFNSGGTTTCDFSQGNLCEIDFSGGNTTAAFTNPHGSGLYWLRSCQDATGGWLYTSIPSNFHRHAQPDPTAGATNCTEQPMSWDGTNYNFGSAAVPNAAWHGQSAPEGTCPATAPTGSDVLCADSVAHQFKIGANGGSLTALGTAAFDNVGTSGSSTIPQLGGGNTWTGSQVVQNTLDGRDAVGIVTSASCTVGTASGCTTVAYAHTLLYNQNATASTAVTITLPTAFAGAKFCIANSYNGSAATTGQLEILTSATGQFIIFTDGTLSATGGYVISGGAAADWACVTGVDSTHWQLGVISGTWTKH